MCTTLSVSVSDSFWSNISAISSRTRQNGLQYAVEECIQYIKSNNTVHTTVIEAQAYRSQSKVQYSNVAVWSKIAASNIIVQGMCVHVAKSISQSLYRSLACKTDDPDVMLWLCIRSPGYCSQVVPSASLGILRSPFTRFYKDSNYKNS